MSGSPGQRGVSDTWDVTSTDAVAEADRPRPADLSQPRTPGAGRPAGARAAALLHLAGLALAVWATGSAIRRFFGCQDLITQVLAVGIVPNLCAFTFSVPPNTYWDDREIASVLTFGAVLAGRLLAERLTAARLLPLLAAVGCCYLVALGYGITRPQVPAHDQTLGEWLSQHHLTTGLASYADGNSLILDSHGRLQVYAPFWSATTVRPGTHETEASQFGPSLHDATFVVSTSVNGPAFYIPRPGSSAISVRRRTRTSTASGRS
jgi:hypothetical protein